jgi:hypothetical protein
MKRSALILRNFVIVSTGALLPLVNGAQLAFAPSGASAQPVTTLQVELGTRFSVAEPLAVAGLAYYDFGSDGFGIAHPVTLWDDVGNVIASVTVSSGSAIIGPSFGGGQFRLENVALTLNPGTYRLSGALAPINWGNPVPDPDPVLYDNSSPSGDSPWSIPGITYLGRVYAPDGSGAGRFPSLQVTSVDADDWFGPNLVVVNAVPEPSTATLVLLAVTAAWWSRRCGGRHRPDLS